jgi:G3E family GTPase
LWTIKGLNPQARIIQTSHGKVDLKEVVNTGLFDMVLARSCIVQIDRFILRDYMSSWRRSISESSEPKASSGWPTDLISDTNSLSRAVPSESLHTADDSTRRRDKS